MASIFKKAYFGKAYKTNDGRKFIFLGFIHPFFGRGKAIEGIIECNDLFTYYNVKGKPLYCEYSGYEKTAEYVNFKRILRDCKELDIISEWTE